MNLEKESSTDSNRRLLSLVTRLCSTLVPNESDNFDKICHYSLDLISKKKISIEDCEEQYILSKIRHSFLKKLSIEDLNRFEDLYLHLKSTLPKSFNIRELLYCLFLLSNSTSIDNATIFSISNSIETMKIAKNDLDLEYRHSHHFGNNNGIQRDRMMTNPNRHTVHVYTDNNNDSNCKIRSKYTLLAKDLISIFQGLHGKHINFQTDSKFSVTFGRNDLFYSNEIYFAKRLSVLGQNFKTIKTYSQTSMNTTSKGFVVQSFGSALNDEINNFYKLMTSIQANFHKPEQTVTLHKLCFWTTESFICFEALVNLIGKCRSKKGGALISIVYDIMHHGDPLVRECYRKILSKVVKPIRKMLNHWIFYGELKDEYKEFFISTNDNAKNVITTSLSDVFWFDQYSINNSMLPGFINKAQAYKILITGKAISMLREVSMNRVSAVLPLYDQLKNSFENSNLEILFDQKYSSEANDFAGLLDYVYKEISQTALNILNAKYQLYEHFIAHKRFLLFEQGDFISYLMELLYPIINRPANKIRPYTLSQTLENAIRKTSAQCYESSDILSRIDIYFDPNFPMENAWDILTLKYRIDGPIGTIFNQQSQVIYTKLFALFWRNKTIEFSLNKCWIDLKNISTQLRVASFLRLSSNHFNYLLYQILSFTKTIEQYFNYLLESRWTQVKNELDQPRNLNRLIKVHHIFLQNLVSKFFFENLLRQENAINKLILSFIDKLESFINDIVHNNQNVEKFWGDQMDQYRKEIEENYNFWLHNFSRMLHKEISLFLELLIDTDEDDHRELCFSIDFNKYYKMQHVIN
ncbi:gamma-tubulin complex component 3-like [Dermatophagoides pteronyssinus]|uniref:Gamma-tubulin complex component 3 homolog n=2 Tax=Dermatophagoides pteronyssinus TaxID=6956 RepID=A0A6P6Y941_DERPT|nr:gamma-tubulin complex component 3 homolog [Dermatophagoides pteronyssinus]KAH9424546.1 Gamma-tubulin complex component 3 [Dermatophagoides pteronyssinus]